MAVLMTVELANKLIDHYEKCIAEVKCCGNTHTAKSLTMVYSVDYGFCSCSKRVFNTNVVRCDWVKSLTTDTYRLFIDHPPFHGGTVSDVIKLLQSRVDILNSFKIENDGCINNSGIGE